MIVVAVVLKHCQLAALCYLPTRLHLLVDFYHTVTIQMMMMMMIDKLTYDMIRRFLKVIDTWD